MSLKKFHEMGLAVVGQRGHVFDRDMLGIVFFYIFKDRLQLFQSFGLDRGWPFSFSRRLDTSRKKN